MLNSLRLIMVGILVLGVTAFADMSITITEPTDGLITGPCQDIVVKTNITLTGETIKDVRFYVNGAARGRATKEPWEYTLKAIQTGNYLIEAKITDTNGVEVWSAPSKLKIGSLSSGDVLINGDFSCGTFTNWAWQINNDGNGTYTVMDDHYFDDDYYFLFESELATTDWYVQLTQTVPLDSGHVYQIFFLADADMPRPVTVGWQQAADPFTTYLWQAVDIDGIGEYSVEYTASVNDPTAIFKFLLGASNATLFLDNIRLIDTSASSVSSKEFDADGSVREYELFQAYPNPFNMSTTIGFRLVQAADVRLDVYNMQGQLVKNMASGVWAEGRHSIRWNGLNESGSIVPSGVYVYRLTAATASGSVIDLSRKILLLK